MCTHTLSSPFPPLQFEDPIISSLPISVTKPAIKPKNQEESTLSPHLDHSLLSGLETLTSPRHYLRRKALVESELQGDVLSVNQVSLLMASNTGWVEKGWVHGEVRRNGASFAWVRYRCSD